jgi:hypothetical protein
MDKWADMGAKSALLTGMGEEAYRQFLPKTAAVQEETETNVYRFMPDLSYRPAAQ